MDLQLEGKTALVSGGSKGIGRAVARSLAAEGVKVLVVARGAEAVEQTVEVLRAEGGDASGVAADMTTLDGVTAAVEAARAQWGRVDIAVSNVPSADPADPLTAAVEHLVRAHEQMTLSVLHLVRAVVPAMREQGWGRVVNIGAGVAKEPPPQAKHALAAMNRAAVVALTKSLSNELARSGVTLNTIGTGFIATESMRESAEAVAARGGSTVDEVLTSFSSSSPARRPGTPEEVAFVVVALCSQLGGYVNGQFLPVDGGALRSAV